MTPVLMLITLGGVLLLLSGFAWLLYRLGGFHSTVRERRSWVIGGAVLLAWIALLAFVGPVPAPVSLLLNAGVIVLAFWFWRSGRFRLDNVPADSREEVARRREWVRAHPRLLVGLGTAFTVLMVVWTFIVVIATRPG